MMNLSNLKVGQKFFFTGSQVATYRIKKLLQFSDIDTQEHIQYEVTKKNKLSLDCITIPGGIEYTFCFDGTRSNGKGSVNNCEVQIIE